MDNHQLALELENVVNSAYQDLAPLSEESVQRRPDTDKWSVKEIIGHLVDSASNNHQRWIRLQISDGLKFPDYQKDNMKWVNIQQYNDQPWDGLLKLWRYFNVHLAMVIKGVNPTCLEHVWIIDAKTRVTLNALMLDYVHHLNIHMKQIRMNLHKHRGS